MPSGYRGQRYQPSFKRIPLSRRRFVREDADLQTAAQNVDKPGRSYEQQWEELMLERQAGAGLMNPFEDNFIILEEQRVGSTPRQNRPSGGRGTYTGPTSGSGPGFQRQTPWRRTSRLFPPTPPILRPFHSIQPT